MVIETSLINICLAWIITSDLPLALLSGFRYNANSSTHFFASS